MQRVRQEIYNRMDNGIYDSERERWWHPDSALYLIKGSLNPARLAFFRRVLERLGLEPRDKRALEVGCGGGILCEEIARLGFTTSGVDPSQRSLQVAESHAKASGLSISYRNATGEALPYPDRCFDAVFCCDVLEHVRDLPLVISEISRVLKPGGVFFYDTVNRTWLSWFIVIGVAQRWKRWAFLPPNLHVWKMFIKPREIKALLAANRLEWGEHRGLKPNARLLTVLRSLRQRAAGALDLEEFGRRMSLIESGSTGMMYLGYAVKR